MRVADQQYILDTFGEIPCLEPGADVVGSRISAGTRDIGRGRCGRSFRDHLHGVPRLLLAGHKRRQLGAVGPNRVGGDDHIVVGG